MSENHLIPIVKALYKRKKFLVIYFIVVTVVSVSIALSARKTFTSYAVVLPPNASPLNSFLPSEMTRGLGSSIQSLTSTSGDDTNKMLSILNSRSLAETIINKFDLIEQFKAKTIEETIENFHERVSFETDEELMVRVYVNMQTELFHSKHDEENTKNLTYNICLFIVQQLDSTFTNLQVERAIFARIPIEERFDQNQSDLLKVQNEIKIFLEENGIISLPEQLEATITSAAQIESQIIIETVELNALKNAFDNSSPDIINRQFQIDELRNALNDFNNPHLANDSMSVLPSISESPSLIVEYATLQFELTVQEILYQFLFQQFEQYKLQEARHTHSIQYIDIPRIPEKRTKPVRSILVLALLSLGMIIGITYVLFIEMYSEKTKLLMKEITNPTE